MTSLCAIYSLNLVAIASTIRMLLQNADRAENFSNGYLALSIYEYEELLKTREKNIHRYFFFLSKSYDFLHYPIHGTFNFIFDGTQIYLHLITIPTRHAGSAQLTACMQMQGKRQTDIETSVRA